MSLTTIVPVSPIVNIDVSSESKVILLPAASTSIGTTFYLRDSKGAASTNSIYVSTIGLDTLDGTSLLALTSTLQTVKVMSLGNTFWSLIQENKNIPSFLVSGTAPLPPTITSLDLIPSFTTGTWYLYISWIPPIASRLYNFDSYTIIDISGTLITGVDKTLTTYAMTEYLIGLNTCSMRTINVYGSSSLQTFSKTISGSAFGWTEQSGSGSRSWTSITSSSDGVKLAAAVTGGYIYTSTDSGVTWTERTGSGSRSWTSITSSSDGVKLAATVNNGYIYTSTNSGSSWTEQATSQNWISIASSSDGTKLAAAISSGKFGGGGSIYTSTDSGANWTEQTGAGSQTWVSITSSSDGTKLYAIRSTFISRSSDSGVNWSSTNLATGGFPSNNPIFTSIVSSSDGTKVAACSVDYPPVGNYIYTTTDSGANWTKQNGSGERTWKAITSSSNGSILLAAVDSGYIYQSKNAGVSWIEETGAGSRSWTSITMSSVGDTAAASVSGGKIWTAGYTSISAAFLPSSIGGRIIHTDAYTLTNFDGQSLAIWPNAGSGGQIDCINAVVNTNILNGYRVVTFAPNSSWIPQNNTNLTSYSMFFVGRQSSSSNNTTILQNSESMSPQYFGYLSGYKKIFNINMSPYADGSKSISDTSWDMFSHTRSINSFYLMNWDGSLLYSGSTSTGSSLTKPIIGNPPPGFPPPFPASDCQVAEILIYNSVLSSDNVAKVEGYLAWKWGLVGNLPSTHPYKNSYPTV